MLCYIIRNTADLKNKNKSTTTKSEEPKIVFYDVILVETQI